MVAIDENEIARIHDALVRDFSGTPDPIDPPGIRDIGLLASAASRQGTSFSGTLKYPEPRANAATLLYGIAMNHAFFNGNKRTALVATLIHMDANGYVPHGVSHDEFYNLILALADHRLHMLTADGKFSPSVKEPSRLTPDEEVDVVTQWLKRRTRKMDKREHPLTFRQLRRILARYKCSLGAPHDNFVDVFKEEEVIRGLFRKKTVKLSTKVTQVSYPGEGAMVTINTVKMIRNKCGLTFQNGIDSSSFYDAEATVDSLLNQYRNLMRRLANV